MTSFFVTGTDTDAGKTYVSRQILDFARHQRLRVLGLKPIAAGCEPAADGQLLNDDALQLQAASSAQLDYPQHNPVALLPPIAPHIAAEQAGITLDHARLNQWWLGLELADYDLVLLEGAGGWMLPLDRHELLSRWVITQQLPVVLVVGMKLGCLNHALLSEYAITQQGGNLVGWVANQVDPQMRCYPQNLAYLKQQLSVPMLGEVRHGQLQTRFNLAPLLAHAAPGEPVPPQAVD